MTLAELIESRTVECCGIEYLRREDGLIAPRKWDDELCESVYDLGDSIELCPHCKRPIDPLVRAGVQVRRDQDDEEPGEWW